ncbi:GNAT family N-acetyltransferase [Pendulispora rubella]|uniref:GNAT family N-acetyltransferase n=1 Tax=Pendulispora rubella TaxID=2741070 RepID=A0ABZ2KYM9_9BACT
MEVRPLREDDDRAAFRSGEPDLDRFLHKFAGQNQFKHYVGVTYVAVQDGAILGYATVSSGHIEIDELPAGVRKKLPQYPLPILRLARLAVDETARGQGLGQLLLRFVLKLSITMSSLSGCIGVVVDAKAGAIDFYKKYGFIPLDTLEGQSEARPQPTEMFLAMRAIKASSA